MSVESIDLGGVESWAFVAANRAGHASAMAINLYMAGKLEQAKVWELEKEAWARRRDGLIGSLGLSDAIVEEVVGATTTTFANIVVEVPDSVGLNPS